MSTTHYEHSVLKDPTYAEDYKVRGNEKDSLTPMEFLKKSASKDNDAEGALARRVFSSDKKVEEQAADLGSLRYTSNGQLGYVSMTWAGNTQENVTLLDGTSESKHSFLRRVMEASGWSETKNTGTAAALKDEEDANRAVNRYNIVVAFLNEFSQISDDASKGYTKKKVDSADGSIDFLPRGTLDDGLYGVSAGRVTADTVRWNATMTKPLPFYSPVPFFTGGLGEGQVGGKLPVDRLSYCSDNDFLHNHYKNQEGALAKAGIKLSQNSTNKVKELFDKLKNIQVRLCKLLRQREIAINGSDHLSDETLQAISQVQDENSFNVVLSDLIEAHQKANHQGLAVILTLEKVLKDAVTSSLKKANLTTPSATQSFSDRLRSAAAAAPAPPKPPAPSGVTDDQIIQAIGALLKTELDAKSNIRVGQGVNPGNPAEGLVNKIDAVLASGNYQSLEENAAFQGDKGRDLLIRAFISQMTDSATKLKSYETNYSDVNGQKTVLNKFLSLPIKNGVITSDIL